MFPTTPSLKTSFSALLGGGKPAAPQISGGMQTTTPATAPAASGINWGALNLASPARTPAPVFSVNPGKTTPAMPSISMGTQTSTPSTATPINFSAMTKPAVPQVGNVQNSGALTPGQFGAGPFATVNANGTSTPSAYATSGGTPAVPSISGGGAPAPAPAPYTPAAPMTMPSGATVDPNTGALLSPATTQNNASAPIGGNTGNAGGTSTYSGSAGGSPAAPSLYSGGGTYDPLITSPEAEDLFKKYQTSLVPTQDELDAMTRLNALNTSAAESYTNTQNQPIALPFITGQQAAIQRSQTTLAQPLESQISLLQAKRTMASTATKSALDRIDAQIAARRDLAKPVSTAYGGTTSRYNPQTGKYETIVNPFGSATGTASGDDTGPNSAQAILGRLAAAGINVTRYDQAGLVQAVRDGATPEDINNARGAAAGIKAAAVTTANATPAADAASLKTQQQYADSTSRAFNTANQNLQQLVNFMTSNGVNESAVPAINQLQNKVKAGLTNAGTIAAFNAALAGLRAEYAQVLSRGGEVTEGQRAQAASLIPDNISPAQLQQVTDRLKVEGANAISEANQKVKDIQTRMSSGGGTNTGSSGGSANDPLGIL